MNIKNSDELERRDLELLARIARGPGNYPTPSPDRVDRLVTRGLVRKKRNLALTLHGRLLAWLWKRGLITRPN